MPILQSGTLNTTALVVPNLYVQIVPPQNLVLNGVPTNLLGVVGTASWGPINQPVAVGTMADYAQNFGPLVARKYDMGTTVAIAVQQGATNFRCVRVTDGSDTAASYAVGLANDTFAIMFTAVNTGSLGNQLSLTLSQNSNTGAWQLVVALPGLVPEVFSNITGATSTLFWQTLANAVNQGIGALRGASQLVVATLPLIPNAVSPTAFGPQLLRGVPMALELYLKPEPTL